MQGAGRGLGAREVAERALVFLRRMQWSPVCMEGSFVSFPCSSHKYLSCVRSCSRCWRQGSRHSRVVSALRGSHSGGDEDHKP